MNYLPDDNPLVHLNAACLLHELTHCHFASTVHFQANSLEICAALARKSKEHGRPSAM